MHEAMVLEQTHLRPALTLGDPTAGGYGELEPQACEVSDPIPTEIGEGQGTGLHLA